MKAVFDTRAFFGAVDFHVIALLFHDCKKCAGIGLYFWELGFGYFSKKKMRIHDDAIFEISIDDYSPLNDRVVELLDRFHFTATFFIETATLEAREQIERIGKRFEIGCHTVNHVPDMKQLPLVEAKGEIEVAKRTIEDLTGKACTKFAYPRGKYNEDITMLVRRAGFSEARTTDVLETHVDNPFRKRTTIHVFDGRKEYKGRTWRQMADFYFDDVVKNGGVFHLWGHAGEIERDRQWGELSAFLSRVKATIEAHNQPEHRP